MISKVLQTQPTAKTQRTADHPVSKRRAWIGWLCWLVFWAAVGIGGYLAYPWVYPKFVAWQAARTAKPPAPAARVIPVIATVARSTDMDIYLSGLGTVTAFNTVTVRSRVDGELVKVAFTEGQMVREGQLLAKIDPRQFQVQLAQAQGNLARDRAILKNAELDLDRYKGLVKTKSISAQQVDLQQAIVEQNEGVVKSDLAQIDSVKLQLSYCQITAPISGRIGLRTVDQGNMVRASDPTGLAVITQLQPISVVFTIPQDDIARVQKQAHAGDPLTVEAFDRDFKTLLATGTLQAADNQVDPTTGTLKLKAVFKNENNALFPNQFVNARLLVDRLKDATVIPAVAVQRGPNSTFVYVVNSASQDETKVELRTVELGPTEGDQTAIASGLAVGDLVVTDGIDKLQPGVKVALRTDRLPAGKSAEQAIAAHADDTAPKQPSQAPAATGNNRQIDQDELDIRRAARVEQMDGEPENPVRKASTADEGSRQEQVDEPSEALDEPPARNPARAKPSRSRSESDEPARRDADSDENTSSGTPSRPARHKASK